MKRLEIRTICRFFSVKSKLTKTSTPSNYGPIFSAFDFNRQDYVANKSKIVKLFNDLGNSEEQNLQSLIRKHSTLSKTSVVYLEKIIEMCSEYLSHESIFKHFEILLVTDLKQKLELIKKCQLDCNKYVNYLTLSSKELFYIFNKIKATDNSHLKTIQEVLGLDEDEIISSLVKHKFVYGLQVDKLRKSLELFKRFEIDPRNILQDIWCVKFSLSKCEKRLQTIKELNISPPKTWMARCSDTIFNRFVTKKQQSDDLLQKTSIDEYLANRLGCTLECALKFRKLSKIKSSTIIKVNDIINILTKYDYSSNDILCTPRIMHRSLNTIQSRLDELKSLGHKPSSLLVLNLTKKEYKTFIHQLKKKNIQIAINRS